jgi:hypothetical protein
MRFLLRSLLRPFISVSEDKFKIEDADKIGIIALSENSGESVLVPRFFDDVPPHLG